MSVGSVSALGDNRHEAVMWSMLCGGGVTYWYLLVGYVFYCILFLAVDCFDYLMLHASLGIELLQGKARFINSQCLTDWNIWFSPPVGNTLPSGPAVKRI